MKNKVQAICLKTYVDEDDMQAYCDGDIKCPSDVKIYHKGRKYWVVEQYVDENFYKIIDKQ
jgi:hypothetical protein